MGTFRQFRQVAAALIVVMVMAVGVSAQTWNIGVRKGPNWEATGTVKATLSGGTLRISGKGTMSEFYLDGDEDASPWRSSKERITNVIIENGVTSIGSVAFSGCANLKSVMIPNSVTSIESGAFSGCTGLTSVTIPNSVESVDWSAFSGCTGLRTITVGGTVTSIGDYKDIRDLIERINVAGAEGKTWDCGTTRGKVTATLSGGTLRIKGMGSMTRYGDDGEFYYPVPWGKAGRAITNVVIENGVTSIGDWAFSGCTGLKSVTISNSVTSIGQGAFQGCTGLKSVTIPNSVTFIGNIAFSGCTGLTSIIIPNRVTSIGQSAFNGCTGLTSVIIPNSVTSIGNGAFGGCSGIKTVTITGSGKWERNIKDEDGDIAEDGISELFRGADDMVTDDNATFITVMVEEGITSIGAGVFAGANITSIEVAAKNVNYSSENGVLFNKNKTVLIQYPQGKRGAYTIPNGVISIGDWAFSYRTGLTSVTIPGSVTSIGNGVFDGCYSLTSITVKNPTPPAFGTASLPVIAAACTLYVPQGSAYAATSGWNGFKHIGYVDSNGKVLRIVSAKGNSFAAEQATQTQTAQLAECKVKKGDHCAELMYTFGTTYYQERNTDMAAQMYQRILDEYPASPYSAAAKQMLASIDPVGQYKKQLAECEVKNGDCAVLMYQLGILYSQKDINMAIQTYQRLLEKYPTSPYSPSVRQMLIAIEQQKTQMQQQAAQMQNTIDQYKKQLAECEVKKGDCSVAMYMLGSAYFQHAYFNAAGGSGHDYSMAIQMYRRLLKEYPTSPYAAEAKQMFSQIETLQKK